MKYQELTLHIHIVFLHLKWNNASRIYGLS